MIFEHNTPLHRRIYLDESIYSIDFVFDSRSNTPNYTYGPTPNYTASYFTKYEEYIDYPTKASRELMVNEMEMYAKLSGWNPVNTSLTIPASSYKLNTIKRK